jgi:hypothetical protein
VVPAIPRRVNRRCGKPDQRRILTPDEMVAPFKATMSLVRIADRGIDMLKGAARFRIYHYKLWGMISANAAETRGEIREIAD